MSKKAVLLSLTGLFSLFFAANVTSCGSTTATARSYSGAGSEWDITMNTDNTFVLTHRATVGGAVDMTINGTAAKQASGFVHMTVTSATGTSAPAAGATADGLEIPGSVFFLQPTSGGNLIVMVPAGTCPTADLALNWTKVKVNGSWTTAQDTFGTFTFTQATGASVVGVAKDLATFATTSTNHAIGTGTCANGVLSIAGTADMFLNQSGGAVVHTTGGGDDSIIFAMPPSTLTAASEIAGNYAGLVFQATGTQNFPVSVELTASTTSAVGPGTKLTSVTGAGTADVNGVYLTLNAVNSTNGFVTGNIDYSGPAGGGTAGQKKNVVCGVQKNANGTSSTVIVCDSTDSGSGGFFSVLLVTK